MGEDAFMCKFDRDIGALAHVLDFTHQFQLIGWETRLDNRDIYEKIFPNVFILHSLDYFRISTDSISFDIPPISVIQSTFSLSIMHSLVSQIVNSVVLNRVEGFNPWKIAHHHMQHLAL